MKALIIFASEIGTTNYMVEVLTKRFVAVGIEIDTYQAGLDGYQPTLTGYDLLVFGSPTYLDGQLQTEMAKLVKMFTPDLSQFGIAVFGLGDSSYPHFCGAVEHLETWIQTQSGTLITKSLKVDGYPQDFETYTSWVKGIVDKMSH